jgi:hypothetical protein
MTSQIRFLSKVWKRHLKTGDNLQTNTLEGKLTNN